MWSRSEVEAEAGEGADVLVDVEVKVEVGVKVKMEGWPTSGVAGGEKRHSQATLIKRWEDGQRHGRLVHDLDLFQWKCCTDLFLLS